MECRNYANFSVCQAGKEDLVMQRIAPRIVVDPDVRFGRPIVEGTRVPVELVIGKLAGGMTIEEVCAEYELAREDVHAALSYAANVLAQEQVRAVG